ncbi:MAG: CotH kinase family protein [Cytophagaceae bacterium]|jgi:hypothetical protein|nr:CotH kinase family protein [Cytophagaceae bacterium]
MKKLFFCLSFFLLWSSHGQLLINEYSCSNFKQTLDNFNKYEDWFEIYNAGTNAVDMSGYMVSDKLNKPAKWKFPIGTVIAAQSYLLVWASNKDTVVSSTHFHTNFKLSQTGIPDKLVLRNTSGVVLDSLTLKKTQKNHSNGRSTNGSSTWGVYSSPTPGRSNETEISYSYAATPGFSKTAGFYSGTQTVSISTSEVNSFIRYTLDGSDPEESSLQYTQPISITSTQVLKARVFANNKLPSFIEYATYFINETHSLPVVSVAAKNIDKMLNNIFENGFAYSETKPEGSLEYFTAQQQLLSRSWGEYNRHGQDSWSCDQRSMDYIARDEMGYHKAITGKLFANSDRQEFQTVILRASGDDNYPCAHNEPNEGSAHMRDGYVHNLAKRGKMHLDVRNSERIIIYVNGAYWGVYEVRERPDDHDYTDYYYKQAKEDLQYILTWDETWAEYGGNKALDDFYNMTEFVTQSPMTNPANYRKADSLLNFKSLVDYIIVNNMTVCTDWLNYNTGIWRGLNPKGEHKKWGYILWDNDATFDFYINYTGVPSTKADAKPCNTEDQQISYADPIGHLQILNNLMENPEFKKFYRNRQADLLNTVFSCQNMLGYLDEYTALIDPEMARHATRWNGTYQEWKTNVATLRSFIAARCVSIESGMKECYNLNGPYTLTLQATPGGTVKVNSLTVSEFPWTGKYYGGIETDLIAKASVSNTFQGWNSTMSVNPSLQKDSIRIQLNTDASITANFSSINALRPGINESQFFLSVYPTVTEQFVHLEFNLPESESANIELRDTEGNLVLMLSNASVTQKDGADFITLDISKANLAQGLYQIRLQSGQYSETKKIIIVK